MTAKDTDEVFQQCCIPNTVIIGVGSVVRRAFLELLECHGVVYVIKELTQHCYLEHIVPPIQIKQLHMPHLQLHKLWRFNYKYANDQQLELVIFCLQKKLLHAAVITRHCDLQSAAVITKHCGNINHLQSAAVIILQQHHKTLWKHKPSTVSCSHYIHAAALQNTVET